MALKDIFNDLVNPKGIDNLLERFNSNVGSYGFDAWGFNIRGVRATLAVGKTFYDNYFRVEAHGLENVPKEGRALIVGNHSGQLPIDGFLLAFTLLTNPHAPRACKSMMERFVPTVPFISSLFAEIGGVVGDPINCARMLEAEEAIIVFPEGSRGISKPFSKRYQLQGFGTGFMNLAVNHKAPIIPVGIVGCEESIIQVTNFNKFASRFGLPSAPVLIPFIFPTKVSIHIGEPMFFEGDLAREDELENYVDEVKREVDRLVQLGLKKRKGVFGF